MRFIEVCCATVDDVITARKGGASRVELCQAIGADGVTPSLGMIELAVKAAADMPVNVLIRPREGNFVYSPFEVETMIKDIEACKKYGVSGVVIGALTPEREIDITITQLLIDAARGMNITFHRAFDSCKKPIKALNELIELGCDHLLTSGQAATAYEGRELLAQLVNHSSGRITIMPGGGINPDNIAIIEEYTKATEFHSTATDKSITPPSDSIFGNNPRQSSDKIIKLLRGAE